MKGARELGRELGSRRGLHAALGAACLSLIAATATAAPSALADKHHAYPTQHQVKAAKQAAADKAAEVASIKASLLVANQQMEQANLAAEQAAEAYDAARWQLHLAVKAYNKAQADAVRARSRVNRQQDRIAGLVVDSYQQGGNLTAINGFFSADGPTSIMQQYLGYQGASDSLDAGYQRFMASSTLAEVFEKKAQDALAAKTSLATQAKHAQKAAASLAAAAQAAATRVAAQKDTLVHELAKAQGVSVKLAKQRQKALDRIARHRAHEAAIAAEQAAQDNSDNGGSTDPTSPPPVPTGPPPPVNGRAGRAIRFAEAQIGDPYQWGAAGPDQWDCSGLTMKSWDAAGVALPHYSAGQYAASTPISVTDLRPGDLVFWGTSNDPASIHHVAMYIGDGKIIHAPRTGKDVEIDDMYYWLPPNFFARP